VTLVNGNKLVAILALGVMLLALTYVVDAQQPGKIPRIGFIATASPEAAPNIEPFRIGLRDLGYIEGKNILIEYRYRGVPDRTSNLVTELVQLKVDVIVSGASPAIFAAKQETKSIPIVMVISRDPVASGLVDSLARPGGNITGVTLLTRDLAGKRLELLKETVPKISTVGLLWSLQTGLRPSGFQEYETAAHALKIPLESLEVRDPNPDFPAAFRAAAKARVNALITVRTGPLLNDPKRIANLAIKNRLPSMHEGSDFVEAGGLMSYAASYGDAYRRAAVYVDKILKGVKPADLPVEQPTKFEFVINLKTAKALKLTIPPNVLARADKVIR